MSTTSIPPILFEPGQHVYLVALGDIDEYIVDKQESWVCGIEQDNRGYRLRHVIDGHYGVTWNHSLGHETFLDKDKAEKLARSNLTMYKCIRKEEIRSVKTIAYEVSFKHGKKGNLNTYFLSFLEDGSVYVRSLGYEHISYEVQHELAEFEKRKNECICYMASLYSELEEYKPVFKNMYSCGDRNDWAYADAGYVSYFKETRAVKNK